jgi:hypothetical protein
MGGATGKCLCGAVRYTAQLENRNVSACHCGMCRQWSAGPMLGIFSSTIQIEDDSSLGTYQSSEWAERSFCKKCGTPLYYHLLGKDFFEISAETLDDKSGLVLDSEIFVDEKPVYYNFANATKKMTGAEIIADIQSKIQE